MKALLLQILLLSLFATGCSNEGLRDVFREYHQSPVQESDRRAYILALASKELGDVRGYNNPIVQILFLEAQLAAGKTVDPQAVIANMPAGYLNDPYILELLGHAAYISKKSFIAEEYYQLAREYYLKKNSVDEYQRMSEYLKYLTLHINRENENDS